MSYDIFLTTMTMPGAGASASPPPAKITADATLAAAAGPQLRRAQPGSVREA